MFIIRTAFWLGIIVMLLPTDKEAQGRMAVAAENGYQQISTLCDRHQTACQNGSAAWTAVKAKAQVAGRMAFDLAMDRLAPQTAKNTASEPASEPPTDSRPPLARSEPKANAKPGRTAAVAPAQTIQPHATLGTLRQDDLVPGWRGEAGRGRI